MSLQAMIPSLIFMTLCAGVGFALVQFLLFVQRRSNRAAASDTLLGSSSRGTVPDGALPELLSIGAVAVIAMVLLTAGYKGSDRAASSVAEIPSGTVSTPATPGEQMTTPSQPRATPGQTPSAPTSSPTTGSGG
jgi:hypothetical protein